MSKQALVMKCNSVHIKGDLDNLLTSSLVAYIQQFICIVSY